MTDRSTLVDTLKVADKGVLLTTTKMDFQLKVEGTFQEKNKSVNAIN
jgi:hypothetical protein